MVAELAAIPIVDSGENKSSSAFSDSLSSEPNETSSKERKLRPKWIKTATRDPYYKVWDKKHEQIAENYNAKLQKRPTIEINAVRSEKNIRLGSLEVQEAEEEEEPLYSVVKKPKIGIAELPPKVAEESQTERIIQKQKQLQKWLASSSPTINAENKPKMEPRKIDNPWSDPAVSIPRGVVGIVGPYGRIYKNPNEQREYMLAEEMEEYQGGDDDVVSTRVDSISDAGTLERDKSREQQQMDEIIRLEINRRPKWRIIKEEEEVEDEEDEYNEELPNAFDDDSKSNDCKEIVNRKEFYEENQLPIYSVKGDECIAKTKANNEVNNDKDSLNDTGSTAGGASADPNQPSNSKRNDRVRTDEPEVTVPSEKPISTTAPPRSLVSRILARARSPDDLLDHSEPYSQLWIVLSNVYGELVIVLMLALCLAEVMDTPVPLLSLQSVFLMYLYVGSIVVIISIYLWVLVDSCGSMSSSGDDIELGGTSLTRFGSLKRAHISKARTAPTSFYIRVGALLFGLATLVFNGLEMAMHSMMQGAECLNDIVFVHPVLHGMFTFLQMHFLFVNSQVLVERFGLAARFGFIHLAATNIAVWARLIVWDSAQEWTYFVHLAQKGPVESSQTSSANFRGFSESFSRHTRDIYYGSSTETAVGKYQPISDEKISQIITLQECLNTNTLGQLWSSSISFLYPFIVQFSLIAAAVTFVMGQNVGKNRFSHKQKFHSVKDLASHSKVGCDGASKGLFLGILSMTAGIVVILIFLVVREDENFPPATLSWLTCGTLIGILALSTVMTISGLIQVKQMSVISRALSSLDNILSNVALFGVQLYSIFTAVVCACFLATVESDSEIDTQGRHVMLLTASILQLLQCFAQSTLIAEASKRSCITRFQMMAKPARQVVTFLLFSNAVLWAFDTVVTQNWVSQELQLRFFGVLAWGIISRICVPLLVFYRFHSCVLLLEIWNKCYRTPRTDLPLN